MNRSNSLPCWTLSSKARSLRALSLLVVCVFITGCVTHSAADRIESSKWLATSAGFYPVIIDTPQFNLQAFVRPKTRVEVLSIYLEGDGHAWKNRNTPSDDPTPIDPVALKLTLKDPAPGVAYLGRPCQYLGAQKSKNCNERVWTNRRFAPEVVAASNLAIDQLKDHYQAQKVKLIGYSGGGAIALLAAAYRTDVVQVITIAGNLDTQAWVLHHRVSPLLGSLNPADFIEQLVNTPQIHFVGNRDEVVPISVAQSYVSKFPPHQRPKIQVVSDYAHVCCWDNGWIVIKP